MLKNGRNSCTSSAMHIHIRYFFVKDHIDKGEIRVEYCPLYLMLADFFTKPLQGKKFYEFRESILGNPVKGRKEGVGIGDQEEVIESEKVIESGTYVQKTSEF